MWSLEQNRKGQIRFQILAEGDNFKIFDIELDWRFEEEPKGSWGSRLQAALIPEEH